MTAKRRSTIEQLEIISNNITYLLSKNNITQRELSEEIGVSESSISKWVAKENAPSMGSVQKIAKYFGVQVSDIVEKRDEKYYYLDEATRAIADEIKNNDELSLLFDAARDASPEDLETVHQMLLALKRKERHDD